MDKRNFRLNGELRTQMQKERNLKLVYIINTLRGAVWRCKTLKGMDGSCKIVLMVWICNSSVQ